MAETLVDLTTTIVDNSYYTKANDNCYRDIGNTLLKSDNTIVANGAICKYKIPNGPYDIGCDDTSAEYMLGAKANKTGTQYRFNLTKLMKCTGDPQNINDWSLVALKATDVVIDQTLFYQNLFGTYVDVQIIPTFSGCDIRCTFRTALRIAHPDATAFGIIFKTDGNNAVFNKLGADPGKTLWKEDLANDRAIEYFMVQTWLDDDPDSPFVHNASTTKTGSVSGETWDAQTYDTFNLTGPCTLDAGGLTLDGQYGTIYIKPNNGDSTAYITANSTGNLTTANTSSTNKIVFTAYDDNSRGTAIGSGSPAMGDYTVVVYANSSGNVYIDNFEVHYSEGNICMGWGTAVTSCDFTLKNGQFRNCGWFDTGGGSSVSFLGSFTGSTADIGGTVLFDNLDFDGTCYFGRKAAISIVCNGSNATVKNCRITPDTTGTPAYTIIMRSVVNGTIQNNIINVEPEVYSVFFDGCTNAEAVFNVITSPNATNREGIRANLSSTSTNIKNNIIEGFSSAGGYGVVKTGGSGWDEDYNIFADCDSASSETLGTNSQNLGSGATALTTVPSGANLDSDYAISVSGYQTKLDYRNDGSDTYNNLSIDEATQSATGYEDGGTDNISPGVQFYWNSFGSVAAADNVTSSSANGNYNTGENINIQVEFDADVSVSGSPQLDLAVKAGGRKVNYSSGGPGDILTFAYTVQDGDSATDLDYTGTDALSLNGGSINTSPSGVPATITLPTPGASGSLGANKDITINQSPAASSKKYLYIRYYNRFKEGLV